MESSLSLQLPVQLPAEIPSIKLFYHNHVESHQLPKVTSSSDSFEILLSCFDQDTIELREEFKILLLKANNTVLGTVNLFTGGSRGVLVDPKFILVSACLSNAVGVILAHNHPSGQTKPSESDMCLTKKIKSALDLVDIVLVDHIILSKDRYYSFSDESML